MVQLVLEEGGNIKRFCRAATIPNYCQIAAESVKIAVESVKISVQL